jgi:hypothetical protein
MSQTCHPCLPIQRLGLAYPAVGPAEATRFLKVLVRPLLVALLLVVLGWSLVVASQAISEVVTGAVAPIVSVPLEGRSMMSEGDLQSQVDAYLTDPDMVGSEPLP